MLKRRIDQTEYPENPPEWYWKSGLHDACIIGVETYEFPFDHNKYTGKKDKYDRNMLSLKIDAKDAMFDQYVKEIRFYNYKILFGSLDLIKNDPTGKNKTWWLSDKLTEENGRYELEIVFENNYSFREQSAIKLRFDRAEVDRK